MDEIFGRQASAHRHHTSPREVLRNVNLLIEQHSSAGQRIADRVTRTVGSWRFIITQSCLLVIWLILNVVSWTQHWDPYPFILLNLMLSFQAAYTAPIIMMSQNRQSLKDRLQADEDYRVNRRAEEEIASLIAKTDLLIEHLVPELHGVAEKEEPGHSLLPVACGDASQSSIQAGRDLDGA